MLSLRLLDELIALFHPNDRDQVTVEAPVNIALTKYWGKHDATLNIPLNDSISITLDMRSLCTRTTITIHRNQNNDGNTISLNHEPPIAFNARIRTLIAAIHHYLNHSNPPINHGNIMNDRITIESVNNFPTAAGLASSASGYAALAKGLCTLYGITDNTIVSSIARHGSGSASRSLHSGFVKWNANIKTHDVDPFDSYAEQLCDDKHWSDLRIIICVACSKEKEIGSSTGQVLSKQTSQLLPQRLINVKRRNVAMQKAIKERNFDELAYITMNDSNEFHAICLDTFPPIFYLNDTSRMIIKLCHVMNDWYRDEYDAGEYMVCYTFDAGPNAVLITRNTACLDFMMKVIKSVFFNGCDDWSSLVEDNMKLWSESKDDILDMDVLQWQCDGVEKIILTKIGNGARVVA
eukprot:9592_1